MSVKANMRADHPHSSQNRAVTATIRCVILFGVAAASSQISFCFPLCYFVNPLVSRCCARNIISQNEVNMKRERLTQIVLVIVGLLNLAIIYFLYMDLRHSSWLLEQKNETEPMFLSFFIPVGVFLLMAVRRPSEHRSMIALAAWWNISHGTVMAIQTVEAWNHGVHRNFTDVIVSLVIGVVLLVLLPAKREAAAPVVA
jgi:hypothetical protein